MNSQIQGHSSSWRQWVAGLAAAGTFFGGFSDAVWATCICDDPMTISEMFRNTAFVILGAYVGAILSDLVGRKTTLLGTLIFVIPRLLAIFYRGHYWMWLVDIFNNVGSGVICTVVPLYISEIAVNDNRGKLLTLQLLSYMFTIFSAIATITSFQYIYLERFATVIDAVCVGISGLVLAVIVGFCPETPHYLSFKKRYEEAGKSLLFFRGTNSVAMPQYGINLPENPYVENQRVAPRSVGKWGELFGFENRRSWAMIFSLIIIRWTSGQRRNGLLIEECITHFGNRNYVLYQIFAIEAGKFIFSIFLVFAISKLARKIPLLIIMLVSLILAVIGMTGLLSHQWIFLTVFLGQSFGHLTLVGITLVYTGEFFSANVRAIAVATVISFEVLARSLLMLTDVIFSTTEELIARGTLNSQVNVAVYLISIIFVMIFYPKTKKPQYS